MLAYFRDLSYPFRLLIFPEGTNLDTPTLQRSNAFAQKAGLAPTHQVLLPRSKGLTLCLEHASHTKSLYDLTIAYKPFVPQNEDCVLKGLFPAEVHIHMSHFAASDLPKTEEHISKWAVEQFAKKEKKLVPFYEQNATGLGGHPVLALGSRP